MGYWLDVIACAGVVGAELIGAMILGMLIQGVVFWTTKFSIYNYLIKVLITDQLNK